MPVRIRLQRHGKKGSPFYWIVAADSRAKRDGRYLEKIGTYNPNTNPATVNLDVDKAVEWLENGAQPSDTARTLLSYRGAMMKHHLNGGVSKGAFSQEEADKRFAAWLEEKQAKIQAKIDGLDKDKAKDLSDRLEAEKAVNQKRIEDLTAAPESEEEPATEEAPAAEAAPESEETPATEEAPAAEAAPESEEAPAVEETPVAEEAPAVEETSAAEEAPQTEETSNEETESKE
jgi:small subunit ribosomal protein S16